jgi:prepilin-type N-terminal cleavage/methylation domain-containing protein
MRWAKYKNGFTIVELLIVIVVIGILSAITIIAFNGVTDRAAVAVAQTSVSQADNKIKAFTVTNSDVAPAALSQVGISNDANIDYQYTLINGSAQPSQYCVTVTVKSATYYMGYDMALGSWVTRPKEGTCADHFGATTKVKQIAANWDFQCLISSANIPYCWGYGGDHLGINDSSIAYQSSPVRVDSSGVLSGKTVKFIDIAGDQGYNVRHACVIASDDLPYCWGRAALGNGAATSNVPVAVTTSGVLSGKTVTSLAVGYRHACVIASDGKAYCWGLQSKGQLGNGSTAESLEPAAVNTSGALAGKTLKSIYAGYDHTCAVSVDGLAYCWGDNASGKLGNGTSGSYSTVPLAVTMSGQLAGKTIRTMAAGTINNCAVASDGLVYCWGSNSNGLNANPSGTSHLEPTAVDTSSALSGKTILSISTAAPNLYRYGMCALASDLRAYCWGSRSTSASDSSTASPIQLSNMFSMNGLLAKQVVHGSSFIFVIASDGELYRYSYFEGTPGKISTP